MRRQTFYSRSRWNCCNPTDECDLVFFAKPYVSACVSVELVNPVFDKEQREPGRGVLLATAAVLSTQA